VHRARSATLTQVACAVNPEPKLTLDGAKHMVGGEPIHAGSFADSAQPL
jgi:hypothetical protein